MEPSAFAGYDGGGGNGSGDAGGDTAEGKVEEKEKEMDIAGGIDMFGGDSAEGGGDY